MPTGERREDVFIKSFLSVYEDLTWADAAQDPVDQHTDGGVEMLATRSSDGKTLAIEHTLIQPFLSDRGDFAFFEPLFLKIENDKTLIVAEKWIQVFVPVKTLRGYPKPEQREIVARAVHEWIRANRLTLPDGDSEHQCAVTGIPGKAAFEISLMIKVVSLPNDGALNVRRQQIENDFPDVVRKALTTKLPKLIAQEANKRVLILERQHMNLWPEQMLNEIRKHRQAFPDFDLVDEIWILETIGYEPGGYFGFALYDEQNSLQSTMWFHGAVWKSRSGKDGIPICNNATSL